MTTAANQQLEQLSREDLIALVIQQQEIIALLQAEVAALKAELEKFRRPPTTSRNSSRPPSLDQKADSDPQRKKRKKNRRGHARQTRPLVDNPDKIIPAPVTECQTCQANLTQVEPQRIIRRQVTEIPPAGTGADTPWLMETFSGSSSAVTRSATTRRFAPRLERSFGKSGSRTTA